MLSTSEHFLFHFFKNFDKVLKNLSDPCIEAYDYFRKHSQNDWALKMIDANSMLESGLIDGNLQFFGSFDECIDLKMDRFGVPQENNVIQYCTIRFPLSILMQKNQTFDLPPFLLSMIRPTAGICLPVDCSMHSDLPIILNQFANDHIEIDSCITKKELALGNRIETIHIAIFSILMLLIMAIIVGTLVDYYSLDRMFRRKTLDFLQCFSLMKNISFLFEIPELKHSFRLASIENISSTEKSNRKQKEIEYFYGIRVISFLFILSYHIFTEAQIPSVNLKRIVQAEESYLFQMITNASLWVDTFFVLSGFFAAHTIFKQINFPMHQENESKRIFLNHPKRLLRRYIRLIPSIVALLCVSILIEVLGSGPLWYSYVEQSRNSCHKNWWNLFLFINNFHSLNSLEEPQQECLPYLWYLAVDFQFHLIAPILIACLIHRSETIQIIGVIVNLIVLFSSSILTAIIIANHHLTPTVLMNVYDLNYINQIYKAAYCRVGPFCIGIILAYFFANKKTNENIDLNNGGQETIHLNNYDRWRKIKKELYNWSLTIVAISLILTITMATYLWNGQTDYFNLPSIVYGAFHRSLWAFAWFLLIWLLDLGHLMLIRNLFSHYIMRILGKLTYQSYLWHPLLISFVINSTRQKIYFSSLNFFFDIIKYFCLTQMFSIITFSMFEKPFINIENLLLR
ncbi:hypothetical protein NH340_JMT08455 [Sarcoptes scabiei]|nr:hypothetical protein NH340_JMT08455 [Sarcoptes scabiei]